MDEVNFKISFAKDLAREMENGSTVIPKNSSVAKFLLAGVKSNLMETINDVAFKPGLFSNWSRVGVLVLCGMYVFWACRRLLTSKGDDLKYTRLEKEMLRRKMKARAHKEEMVKGSVEVVQNPIEPRSLSFTRPNLDKEVLMHMIAEVKESNSKLKMMEESNCQNKKFEEKIEEIRAMARHARETETGSTYPDDQEAESYQASENLSSHGASREDILTLRNDIYDHSDITRESMSFTDPKCDIGKSTGEASGKKSKLVHYGNPDVVIPNEAETSRAEVSSMKLVPKSSGKKLRIIKSAKEAREYLSRKDHIHEGRKGADTAATMVSTNEGSGKVSMTLDLADEVYDTASGMHDFSHISEDHSRNTEAAQEYVVNPNSLEKTKMSAGCEVSVNNHGAGVPAPKLPVEKEDDIKTIENNNCINETPSSLVSVAASKSTKFDCKNSILREDVTAPLKKQNSVDTEKSETFVALLVSGTTGSNDEDTISELSQSVNKENWIEKNFHEFEPIVERIAVGFQEGYQVAREKASLELDLETDIMQLKSDVAEDELEWMNDERLREIVFKVRDNELAGRDPFYLMEEDDKSIFFRGLGKKVEKVNEKLLNLHEYFHSNIENLDYGADGISIYDPPEKFIPRWKVPPAEKNPEFLENFLEQRKALAAENLKNSSFSNNTGKSAIRNTEEPSSQSNLPLVRNVTDTRTELHKDALESSKTIIQGSDGSSKKGKRTGKEFWQHTKKWSQGFLESYNAETDPEVKAVMRDIGKDLDKWITEKEIQEAANLMDNLPKKGQEFIRQKLDKVKREMELFGPQAVVSKYREYAEEKGEDYLWWLDLPFVLCIELYTIENGEQRVGFYSLEMAADLELDPKQFHVIAFEDVCDCKNLCYIIQARMEVLGNGNAFVVPRPPKDAFREAKANGFSVTVIRKGQLQLNIDQTLEEVEESITEIGSKIYHDKIMNERGVDVNALMKGVFGINKPAKRKRSKLRLKQRHKP